MLQGKPADDYRDSNLGLAVGNFQFFSPGEPKRAADGFDAVMGAPIVCKPPGYTKWDQTLVQGDATTTLRQFLQEITDRTGATVTQLNPLYEIPGAPKQVPARAS